MAAGGLGAGADHHCAAAAPALPGVPARRHRHARGARRSAAADSGRLVRGARAPGFEQLDADGDGRISRDEFNAAPRGGMGPGMGGGMRDMQGMGRNMPSFATYDANGDVTGYIGKFIVDGDTFKQIAIFQ